MREKIKSGFVLMKEHVFKIGATCTAVGVFVLGGIPSHADAVTPTSLMDASVLGIVQDFAADLVPTILSVVTVVIPVGLTLFGIGFALKKGLGWLMRKAKSAF